MTKPNQVVKSQTPALVQGVKEMPNLIAFCKKVQLLVEQKHSAKHALKDVRFATENIATAIAQQKVRQFVVTYAEDGAYCSTGLLRG
jgi:fructose-1-phosphate kinase PfkB-like protein